MISQLDTYPMGPSMNHLFSHVENLALRRQHTTVSPAHVAHCAAGIPSFGQALLGPACGHEKIRELARRAEARLTELGCQRIATDVKLDETLHAILTAATSQAQESGAAQVGLDHFVLALLQAVEFANDFLPLDEREWRQSDAAARERLASRRTTVITHTPTLDLHSVDLTKKVRDGDLEWPVCGRQAELMLILRILLRRTKRNPVLVGQAGCGKSTLLAAVAASMLESPMFSHYRLVQLDLASVVAGTKYRGEMEDRLKRILKELRENPSVQVAIDELHLLQTGGSETSANLAEFFKPALASGELSVIGATCPENLPELFRDSAIQRRFEPVFIEPLDGAAVRQVLKCVRASLQEYYAAKLDVALHVADDVLEEIPALAARILPHRAEPDASITLLQDAIAAALVPAEGRPHLTSQSDVVATMNELEAVSATLRRTAKQLRHALSHVDAGTDGSCPRRRSARVDVLPREPRTN